MTDNASERHAAAQELHRLSLICIEALRQRAKAIVPGADTGDGETQFALGVEMHSAAPALLLLGKPPQEMLPRELMRVAFAEFSADETTLARVAAAIANLLLQDAAPQTRQEVIRLVRSGAGHLSLYVRQQPFEAALELHAGSDLMELGRIADQPVSASLQ
jgi:hypothetical protein